MGFDGRAERILQKFGENVFDMRGNICKLGLDIAVDDQVGC